MKITTSVLLTAAAVWALGSCASSETGNGQNPENPTVTVQLALTAAESTADGSLLLRDADGSAFTVTDARAVIASIKFHLPDGLECIDGGADCDVTIELDGPWLVDLLTGDWTPPLTELQLPPGSYDRVELRFDDKHVGLVPTTDPLHEASLVTEGVLNVGGTDRTYQLRLDFNEKARFDGAATVGPDAMGKIVNLTLDATNWFADAPIVKCAEDGDFSEDGSTLQLGEGGGGCSDVEDQVKEAIKNSGELKEDDD
jgi:hypothetical protein